MAMIFPMDSLLTSHRELGLIFAVFIGFGFGFALERAGFGLARKLAAQFYLYDMTVFKVMFSAIVTAMLGVITLSALGLADLQAISDYATSSTFWLPMLAGGLLLGVGFIIAGYCPGTSIVSAASGNVDGLVTFFGVIVGSLLYSEAMDRFSSLASFHSSGDLGHVYLYEWLGVPAPLLALAVTLMAVGCFVGAEKVEGIFRAKLQGDKARAAVDTGSNPLASGARRFAFLGFGATALVGLAAMFLPIANQAAPLKEVKPISAKDLGHGVLEEPWKWRVIDLRKSEACLESRIPGSECVPVEKLPELELSSAPEFKTLVYVSETLEGDLPADALAYPGTVRFLEGGFSAWKAFAQGLPSLSGIKLPPAPPPAPASGGGFRKKSGGGGCSG